MQNNPSIVGRFAPTPSGRMHLGNLLCALVAWLSARSRGGRFLLRIEDLDRARCKNPAWSDYIKEDLAWLGIDYDNDCDPSTYQSNRDPFYEQALESLRQRGLLYPCFCSRDELHVPNAPHASDGQLLYPGTCRKYLTTPIPNPIPKAPCTRICVPNESVSFTDGLQGLYAQNLANECSDFILRRSDGIFSYQLAVVVDDALSSVTEVVRGYDLLSSTPRQIWLYRLLGYSIPQFYHIPLLCAPDGSRLSKRDRSLDAGALRNRFISSEPIIGIFANTLGITETTEPIRAIDLCPMFSFDKIPHSDRLSLPIDFFQ